MKVTLRQLENQCRELNQSLRSTPWGVAVERQWEDVAVMLVPRKPGTVRTSCYVGNTREVSAFLDGIFAGVSFRVAYADGPDTQDGSD